MYRRWTVSETAEVDYAIAKLEEYEKDGNRDAVLTALAQLRATRQTYGYRKQHSAKLDSLGPDEETR